MKISASVFRFRHVTVSSNLGLELELMKVHFPVTRRRSCPWNCKSWKITVLSLLWHTTPGVLSQPQKTKTHSESSSTLSPSSSSLNSTLAFYLKKKGRSKFRLFPGKGAVQKNATSSSSAPFPGLIRKSHFSTSAKQFIIITVRANVRVVGRLSKLLKRAT